MSGLPYVRTSDTSRMAAESMDPRTDESRIMTLLRAAADDDLGLTCDDVEYALDLRHQTASARIRGLAMRGLIKDTGRREPTRSGRLAAVWTVV